MSIYQRIPYYEELRKYCLNNVAYFTLQTGFCTWFLIWLCSHPITLWNILAIALTIAAGTWSIGIIIREVKKAREYRLKSRTIKDNKEL